MHVVYLLWGLNLLLAVPLTLLAIYTAYWMTFAWHSPAHYDNSVFVDTTESTQHKFSIIVPVRDEPYDLMAATVLRALAQSHPFVQVLIAVGYDDVHTLASARRLAAEHPRITVAVSESDVHNKPTQLNAALPLCIGDIIGILDAESQSAPNLLTQVDAAFQQSGVDVVQGGVIMTNYRDSFVALRSCLEYYLHHRSKAHYSASKQALLMGGNTVFFRADLIRKLGGWDEVNLAEDAEIGIRLVAMGHDVHVAYDPHLVTREEAPTTIRTWTKQRTRWNLGFLQTLTKGVWRDLPTAGQRRFALWALLQPTLMAVTGIAIPVAIFTVLTNPPLWITMLTFAPLLPTLTIITLECASLSVFGQEMGFKIRVRDYVKLALSTPVYQLMMAFAAMRATVKYVQGDFSWAKTHHTGTHLHDTPAVIDLRDDHVIDITDATLAVRTDI